MEYILFALFIKHAVADLLIQSYRPPGDKAPIFSKTNFIHSGDHGILTLIVFLYFSVPYEIAIALAVADFVLHYLIDCSKTNTVRYFNWDRDSRAFWRVQAFDQMAHYLTYMLLIVCLDVLQNSI